MLIPVHTELLKGLSFIITSKSITLKDAVSVEVATSSKQLLAVFKKHGDYKEQANNTTSSIKHPHND